MSGGHRGNFDGFGPDSLIPDRPLFMKKIQSRADKYCRMVICKEFLDTYQIKLSRDVVLKLPSGDSWRIGLTELHGMIWLEYGWRQFTEFYSIQAGQYLLFKYLGNSEFSVGILTSGTAYEIFYPVGVDRSLGMNDVRTEDPDVSTELHLCSIRTTEKGKASRGKRRKIVQWKEDESIPQTKMHDYLQVEKQKFTYDYRKDRSINVTNMHGTFQAEMQLLTDGEEEQEEELMTNKNMNGNFQGQKELFTDLGQEEVLMADRNIEEISQCERQSFTDEVQEEELMMDADYNVIPHQEMQVFIEEGKKDDLMIGTNIKGISEEKLQPVIVPEKSRAYERVSSFKSKHPYFILFLLPSHVSDKYIVALPQHFSKHFSKVPTTITLSISDNRTWSVSCYGGSLSTLFICWDSFARYNKLEADDICVLELIERGEVPVLRVFISREKDIEECDEEVAAYVLAECLGGKLPAEVQQQSKTLTFDNKTALGQAEAFKSPYPTFIAVMQLPYDRILHVPADFAKSYFSKPEMLRLSVSDGRHWESVCFGDGYLSICWVSFVKENRLQLGDVCAFELIERGFRPELRVTVFRKVHLDQNNQGEGIGETTSSKKSESNTLKMGIIKKSSAFEKASAFKSTYPFVVKHMRKTYLSYHFDLYLPAHFTRQHFRIKPKIAILCIPDRKAWQVKWFFRGEAQGFIWTEFVIENNLGEEDACVFELVKNDGDKPVFMVTIFRKSDDELEPSPSTVSSTRTLNMGGDFIDKNTSNRECTALVRARAFKCNHPFFKVTVNPSYLLGNHGLYVPQKFVREYLNTGMKSVSFQVPDREEKWDVICRHMSTRLGVIYLGWGKFAEDNNVKLGDVCIFVMIDKDKTKPVLEVVIFRAGEDVTN